MRQGGVFYPVCLHSSHYNLWQVTKKFVLAFVWHNGYAFLFFYHLNCIALHYETTNAHCVYLMGLCSNFEYGYFISGSGATSKRQCTCYPSGFGKAAAVRRLAPCAYARTAQN
ncbi:hypothetical protein C7N43_02525 [Sphingobacteriales bacterium UPWRP_1]|nr:hypothetical protein B6N25_06025 [Sphingobacteriales bacterium TSM_CSS]PSJ78629.1 hypothetical protein C7N43_02525 [Sphingobacteriales bacterium UPWRP_1]